MANHTLNLKALWSLSSWRRARRKSLSSVCPHHANDSDMTGNFWSWNSASYKCSCVHLRAGIWSRKSPIRLTPFVSSARVILDTCSCRELRGKFSNGTQGITGAQPSLFPRGGKWAEGLSASTMCYLNVAIARAGEFLDASTWARRWSAHWNANMQYANTSCTWRYAL